MPVIEFIESNSYDFVFPKVIQIIHPCKIIKVFYSVKYRKFTSSPGVAIIETYGEVNTSFLQEKGGSFMPRMFRVLGFWTLVIGLMALAGNMPTMAMLFFFQTAVFVILGYMNLSERTYILLFWGYLILSFTGFTYWSFFRMEI
jgi:hypothetical protein